MNPIGIGIGLILSSSGPLMTGIFYSISAGTFIYISSVEMIVVINFNINSKSSTLQDINGANI